MTKNKVLGGVIAVCAGTFFGGIVNAISELNKSDMCDVAETANSERMTDTEKEQLKNLNNTSRKKGLVWTFISIVSILGIALATQLADETES